MIENSHLSRRSLLCAAALAAAAAPFAGLPSALGAAAPAGATPQFKGLKIGVCSDTFRKFDVAATIKGTSRVGLSYVSIKDFHLPMKSTKEQRQAVSKQFRDGGVIPLSCGVVTMTRDEANIRNAFEYARDAGMPTMVCNPEPESLPTLDKMVKEFDIRLAIHNHGPGDKRWPLPSDVFEKVEKYDQRIGLCIDVGHTGRLKADPAEAILKYRSRLWDVHMKDISKMEPSGDCIEGGRGVLNLKAIFQALLEIKFEHLIGIEYEKDADDPVPGLAETVGCFRGILNW